LFSGRSIRMSRIGRFTDLQSFDSVASVRWTRLASVGHVMSEHIERRVTEVVVDRMAEVPV
jgi:hypothetical protein